MTLSATVSAHPDTKSRFSTPRRFNRRYVIQDCSEDEDEDLDDPTHELKKIKLCHSAPSRINIRLPDRRIPRKKARQNPPSLSPLTNSAQDVAPSPEKMGESSSGAVTTIENPVVTSTEPKVSLTNSVASAKDAPEAVIESGPQPAATMATVEETVPTLTEELQEGSLPQQSDEKAPASRDLEASTDSDGSALVVSQSKRGRKKRRASNTSPPGGLPTLDSKDMSVNSYVNRKRGSISRRSSEPLLQTIREEETIEETLQETSRMTTRGALKESNRVATEESTQETLEGNRGEAVEGGEGESLIDKYEDGTSRSDESEPRFDAEEHPKRRRRRKVLRAPVTNVEEVDERLRNILITWERRNLTAFSIPGYLQYLWDMALKDSENPKGAVVIPFGVVILRNVLAELQLHRFGKEMEQFSFKGIKIRYEPKRVRQTITEKLGRMKYRFGVSETTQWVYIGIARSGLNPIHERRLEKIMGRLNLVPIRIMRAAPLPQGYMSFLPVHKKKTLQVDGGEKMSDSSDEEPLSKAAASAYREWHKDAQMLRWLKADHDKSHRDWWTVTSTSLDCDGFNDEFGVPAALGFDLKRIQMKIAEALREVDGGAYLRNCSYGDDDLRQTAYTEEAGNHRWSALDAPSIHFQYPDCNDLSPNLIEEAETHPDPNLQQTQDTAQEEPPPFNDAIPTTTRDTTVKPPPVKESAGDILDHRDALADLSIPKKKRKLECGTESPLCPPSTAESMFSSSLAAVEDKAELKEQSTSFVQAHRQSSTPSLQSKRLKRSREELECSAQPSDTTTTTSGPLSSSPPIHSSNAVMSRECQVVARRKNGSIFFMESFRELSLDIIGRSLWWIFAIGHTSVTEHLLAYHGPTILWNLRRLRRPWSTVVTEVLEDYRSRAMEDPRLNSSATVERVNEFLTALKRNPEVRHRRLATLKFRGSMTHHINIAQEPSKEVARDAPHKETTSSPDSNDDADYNRAICDIVGLRTALFYSKPRFHRMFHETRVTLCKCTRCRNKFKSSVNTGDGRIIRDIESDSTSDTRSVAVSPTQTDFIEGDPELVAELKSLALDKMDDYVTGTRVLSGHSEKTMLALKALLEKCSGNQCEMSSNVRDQLEECITMWLHQKPTVDTPSEKPKRSRRDRAGHVNEGDVEELRRCFFDDEFFPMRSAYRLNWLARKQLYSMCSDHDWIAPILIARNEKGRAVYAAAVIYKGDFVCEYKGIFYSQYGIARAKESDYTLLGKGSFMFYFRNPLTGTTSCIDATAEDATFGPARLINHSHRQPNLEATVVVPSDDSSHDRRARLIFFASRDIRIGEELLIDYGENKPETLRQNSWLYD